MQDQKTAPTSTDPGFKLPGQTTPTAPTTPQDGMPKTAPDTASQPVEIAPGGATNTSAAPLRDTSARDLAIGGAAWAYGRPRRVQLTVEDELRTVHARPGATQPIYDKAGNQVARLKTTLFGHQLIDLREGAQVRLGR